MSSDVVLREALRLRELPAPPRGMPADRTAAAAIAFAAGGDRAAGADSVDAWARLATSYAAAWKSRRAANGLVPVAGCALCVSRGGAIGVMRPLDALEATLASAAAAASAPGYGSEKGVRRGGFALPATATPATKAMTIGANRGRVLALPNGGAAWITVHPSYLLRLPDEAKRAEEYDRFVADLRGAAGIVAAA